MWQKDDKGYSEELQFKFTGYLIQGLKRTRRDYDVKLHRRSEAEWLTDEIYAVGKELEQDVMERLSVWDVIESSALLYAMRRLDERERYVFLTRILDEYPFDRIGAKLGLSYKGAAAVYYRALQKLKKYIKEAEKNEF